MLTNASHYRYVDNTQMFASGVHNPPHIVPERDGTASIGVETYEDYCYLVEMARERQHWTQGGDKAAVVSVPASQFDPSSLVAKRGNYHSVPLQAIAHALEPDYIEDMGHDATCALIPHDASIALTIYGRGYFHPNSPPSNSYEFAEDKMRQGLSVARSTPAGYVVPRVLECDSMRRFYYDLGRMKRYLFRRIFSIAYPSGFNSWDSTTIWSHCQHVSDPVASTESFTAVPFFGMMHYETSAGSGEWVTDVSYSDPGTWNFYVVRPFYKNPVTGSAYYSSLQARLLFDVHVQNGIYQSGSFTMICRYNDLPVAPYSGTHDDVFEGVCSLTIDGSDLRPFYELAERWYETNVTPLDENESWAVEITLNRIYFDTGAIDHVSNLPSSWQWTPPSS